jgi:hypothetical protein
MRLLLLIFFALFFFQASSQDFPYGRFSPADLEMKQYSKDPSANAVVLKEFGNAFITNVNNTEVQFEHHVRIKIFNSKGFNHGDIVIPIFKDDNKAETITNIVASTFYVDEKGEVQEMKLDIKKIYTENKNKRLDLVKFAMPNLRDGCVVEYSYTLNSPYIFNFRRWIFQQEIPKISSQYTVHIPAAFNYNVTLNGALQLSATPKPEIEKNCFQMGNSKSDCSKITYEMADIPALAAEDYMTSLKDYRSEITFELSNYIDYNGNVHKITQEWKDVDSELKRSESFGAQIKKKDLFKDKLTPVLANKSDDLSKAQTVYTYLQGWFKWDKSAGTATTNGLKKALDAHSGSVAEINFSLVAALNAAGLNAEVVLLSTRDNGIVNKIFPVISEFNYVIAKVDIDGKSYLLDACDPILPFGLLPLHCINDQGRVMPLNKPSYWIDLKASQKKSKVYNLNLKLEDDGKMRGSIICSSTGYEAYDKRKAIKKFNSIEEFVENYDEQMPKIKILKSDIHGVDDIDSAITEKYEVEIDAYDNLNKQRLIFSPFIMDRVKENPFKLAQRIYPLDLGVPSETTIILTLSFPEKFNVIEQPLTVKAALPGSGGRYLTNFELINSNQLIFSQLISLSKSVYEPAEYPYLKELFNKIVQTQNTGVIFQRKP